ncbi:Hypothetical protein LOCK908_1480 [Lacticaseibacillus rhamnosus LOCK908]|uniref:Uncharacterized protein n=1 Tax=Lacticaseibacillus rhamnosus LRHMDP3 TaxID=1203259 RepID=A0AB33XQD4_LACRH|nr:Hypothetical protein LOCK900_1394 [Lacticaseibacillus rhamnosus LOCK900]AGP74119.1 Hypothetical protein LOCK908_1480 [Lacticaseibacillus rhamnosus LOCK908]EKS48372.1 hypothetical protein LRHMDP3_2916 [Lacticaseibacillus rhamnosus LRHMDP3]EKS48379.1 hypothetical protein LRHMDP2_2897 [Lacticaseibacillus rhamnosus LRHMDP2]
MLSLGPSSTKCNQVNLFAKQEIIPVLSKDGNDAVAVF